MPTQVWIATANIHLGLGSSFVLAYTPGNVVPDHVVTQYGLAASGLVQQATIADNGTSPNWRGTDPVTHSELDAALAALPGGTSDVTQAELDTAVAEAKSRANHTGTQTAATISDLREAVEDYVAALLAQGTNVTLAYTDNGSGAGSLTIASTGGGSTDPEAVRDAIGIALVGVGLVAVAVNDAGDTITISTTATANSTDAQLRDRSTHTGAQAISTVTGLQTALDGKAASAHTHLSADITDAASAATANMVVKRDASAQFSANQVSLTATAPTVASHAARKDYVDAGDTAAKARANHTGSQAISTVTGLQTALDAKVTAGTGVTSVESITQAAYNALGTKVATTLYVIVG